MARRRVLASAGASQRWGCRHGPAQGRRTTQGLLPYRGAGPAASAGAHHSACWRGVRPACLQVVAQQPRQARQLRALGAHHQAVPQAAGHPAAVAQLDADRLHQPPLRHRLTHVALLHRGAHVQHLHPPRRAPPAPAAARAAAVQRQHLPLLVLRLGIKQLLPPVRRHRGAQQQLHQLLVLLEAGVHLVDGQHPQVVQHRQHVGRLLHHLGDGLGRAHHHVAALEVLQAAGHGHLLLGQQPAHLGRAREGGGAPA
jgi:hypothetical protein